MMFCNLLRLNRAESTKPYMKRHFRYLYTLFFYRPEKLFRKMKTCRRRCRRTGMPGIDSLISVFILKLMGNVRRKRHLSQSVQYFLKNSIIIKPDQTVSFLGNLQYFPGKYAPSKADTRTGFRLFSRPYQCFPYIIFSAFKQQQLDPCPGSFLFSDKPRRNYFRIVNHKTVSRIQVICNFPKNTVRNSSRPLV